jgi:DNA-directed RNA polymerase subunit L
MSKAIHNYNKTTDNEIQFELHNNDKHKISFMNAIRRICIADININCVDINSITVFTNTSCLNESMLNKRLELSPIYKKSIYDNLKVSLNITNNDHNIKSVYLTDFVVLNKHSNKEEQYQPDDIFVYPRILFAKVQYGETIHMEGEFTSNNSNDDNSAFCPVCPISFHFKQDETEVANKLKEIKDEFKQNDFKLRDADRLYKKNSKNEPTICVYTLESCGNMSSHQIFSEGLDVMRNKLQTFITNVKTSDTGSSIEIKKADYNVESFDYRIRDEDTTLGNILQDYLFEHSNVNFVGYDIPHPLDPLLIIRIGLNKDNTIDGNNAVMIEVSTMLIGYIDELQKEWGEIQ